MIRSVLFICTGNSCRSVMAEAILREHLRRLGKKNIDVRSAGVRAFDGLPPSDGTIQVMEEEGIDLSGFKTKSITPEAIRQADLILVMDPVHKTEVLALAPEAKDKTYLLKEYGLSPRSNSESSGVQDPIGMSVEKYRAIRDEIAREIERFAKDL